MIMRESVFKNSGLVVQKTEQQSVVELCVCLCMCVYIYIYMYTRTHTHTHTHTHTYIHTHVAHMRQECRNSKFVIFQGNF